MKRREFITLLGGAAVWPVTVRAQHGDRVRRVGVLVNVNAGDQDREANIAAFIEALRQLGWVDGRNIKIETRWASGDLAASRRQAEQLVALAPDVIVATGNAVMGPLLQATRTLPIVFCNVLDAVGSGYVESLAQPGGNATGFISFEYDLSGKWLELLKEIAPQVT